MIDQVSASRLPSQIEQVINGEKVTGYEVLPITENSITYALSSNRYDARQDYFITAADSEEKILWSTSYFIHYYNLDLETDVQDIFPVDFYFDTDPNVIVIKLEHYTDNGHIFRVRKTDGDLIEK